MDHATYRVTGRVVERIVSPRCRLVFVPNKGGGLECFNPDWIDSPPLDAQLVARIMREAGDAMREKM